MCVCVCVCVCVWEREREREREWMNEWMNKLYFTRVVEKTRGLFTSSPRPWGKLLLTKDTVSYSALCIRFYNNPAPLNGSTQFHYCTDSNPGTGADDAFVLKGGVWRNATWPSHSRPAIAASARHFQICFSPLIFWLLVCLPTLCSRSPFYVPSHV